MVNVLEVKLSAGNTVLLTKENLEKSELIKIRTEEASGTQVTYTSLSVTPQEFSLSKN